MSQQHHRVRVVFVAAFVLSVLVPPAAQAWNDTGHRLVALVAYERLDPATRKTIVVLIKQHERFEEDFRGHMPQSIREADEETQNKWIFLQAAIWPDIARKFSGPLKAKHHHATWHFINQPVFLTEADEEGLDEEDLPINLDTVWSPGMRLNSMNIIQAIQRSRTLFANATTSAVDKAILLSWLFHLVGDLHQPLHSSAIFSLGRFAEGDRGGNEVPTTVRKNLHSFWDGTVGNATSLTHLNSRDTKWLADANMKKVGEAAAKSLNDHAGADRGRG